MPLIPCTRLPDAERCGVHQQQGGNVPDATLGVDVSKVSLDANCIKGLQKRAKTFANTPEGWKAMVAWLTNMGTKQAHACMEATGRHSLGLALALHDAGHVVSVVNPAQIRDFGRTKLGRNKTDKVDANLIREYAELFTPGPWMPPSRAMRRLSELETIRAGIVGSRTEWSNRIKSGLGDSIATKLATATIEHFAAQLKAIDKAIRQRCRRGGGWNLGWRSLRGVQPC